MASYLRPRRGRKSTAETQNIILKKGEIFFEVPEEGVGKGYGRLKMGDGINTYKNLPYFSDKIQDSNITFTESSTNDNDQLLDEIVSGSKLDKITGSVKKILRNFNTRLKTCPSMINIADLNDSNSYIYISPSGSDTTGNGSVNKPYRTISRGIKDIPDVLFIDGSIDDSELKRKQLVVAAGTYNESIYCNGKDVYININGDIVINAKKDIAICAKNQGSIRFKSLSASHKYSITINGTGGSSSTAIRAEKSSYIAFTYIRNININNIKWYVFIATISSTIAVFNSCENIYINETCTSENDDSILLSEFLSIININSIYINISESVNRNKFAFTTSGSYIGLVLSNNCTISENFQYSLVSFYGSTIYLYGELKIIDNSVHKAVTNYGGKIEFDQQFLGLHQQYVTTVSQELEPNTTISVTYDIFSYLKHCQCIGVTSWSVSNDKCHLTEIFLINPTTVRMKIVNDTNAQQTTTVAFNILLSRIF